MIAVLALQGAFVEHQQMLQRLDVNSILIRNIDDWNSFISSSSNGDKSQAIGQGLIIPGGESTAMTRIMRDNGLWQPIHDAINDGLPVFGTCAGMIMLDHDHLGTMDMKVKRNAYGRQLGSFVANHQVEGIGVVPMTFIRAPYIEYVGEGVEILSVLDNHVIAARQGNQFVCSFHPELTNDTRTHEYFLKIAGF